MAALTRAESEQIYRDLWQQPPDVQRQAMRHLARNDLYFLMTVVCGRKDLMHDWMYDRAREVEAEPDGCIDLWSRFHGKSSWITFGLSLRDILRDPNTTICILSFNRPTAKMFMRQLKREFEENEGLKKLFPEICWQDPKGEAPSWSEDSGILVKRTANPKEATVEAYGLVDGAPVGRHPTVVVYDDVVTADSVSSPEMIQKTTKAFRESLAIGGVKARRRIVGTRWNHADTYHDILQSGAFKPRIYPVRDENGVPALLTEEQIDKLYQSMAPAVFSAQMLLDPRAESEIGFSASSIRYYRDHHDGHGMNIYIVVDPANSRAKGRSYTAMAVIGLGADGMYYWLDGIRDRIGLDDRIKALFSLHRAWQSRIGTSRRILVGYECYGVQQADVEQILKAQAEQMYRFPIVELRGRMDKMDRIPLMEPDYVAGRWYWPEVLLKLDKNGQQYDLVQKFRDEEFLLFPFGAQHDYLDAMSRIYDPALNVVWPKPEDFASADRYDEDDGASKGSEWAA